MCYVLLRHMLGMNVMSTAAHHIFHKDGRLRCRCARIPLSLPVIRMDVGLSSTGLMAQRTISLLTSRTKGTVMSRQTPLDREEYLHSSLRGLISMSRPLWLDMAVQDLVTFRPLRRMPQKINPVAFPCPSTNAVIAGKVSIGPVV